MSDIVCPKCQEEFWCHSCAAERAAHNRDNERAAIRIRQLEAMNARLLDPIVKDAYKQPAVLQLTESESTGAMFGQLEQERAAHEETKRRHASLIAHQCGWLTDEGLCVRRPDHKGAHHGPMTAEALLREAHTYFSKAYRLDALLWETAKKLKRAEGLLREDGILSDVWMAKRDAYFGEEGKRDGE